MDLIADIGATHTRCALINDRGKELATEVFDNAGFTGVAGILSVYLDHRRETDSPQRAAWAVNGSLPHARNAVRDVRERHSSQADGSAGIAEEAAD